MYIASKRALDKSLTIIYGAKKSLCHQDSDKFFSEMLQFWPLGQDLVTGNKGVVFPVVKDKQAFVTVDIRRSMSGTVSLIDMT